MSSFSALLFLGVVIPCVLSADLVPVLLWDSYRDSSIKSSSIPFLSRISQDEFKGILAKKLQNNPVVIVFAEENLSIEDFSWQDELGRGAFPNLHNLSRSGDADLLYLPFVESPLAVLEHMYPQNPGWNEAILGPEGIPILSKDTPYSNFLKVNLEDAKVSDGRSDLLKRHDSTIYNIYQDLRHNHDHVIAIYTSLHSSWHIEENIKSRKIREAEENAAKESEDESPKRKEAEEGTEEQAEAGEPKEKESSKTSESATSPSPAQPSPSPSAIPTYGPPEEWPPFMTIPILSGLMVTSLLLGILGFAISAMMEIKPMMRFDDPKGKSLTFAVQE
ncbi:V-type proton ATPase subunit S1 [Frankliniella fusca]|uniref:V-type proton ATPase subunit S1 n=1 Tax=Frankliniella fusca TaxID=407009 RepID=A0AAE1LCG6_9NEOP|nr:V-type proton ATPase subunit S1 [Frankliniella fusca]